MYLSSAFRPKTAGVCMLAALSFSCLAACASQRGAAPASWSFGELDRLSTRQWEEHEHDQPYARYNTEWLLFNNANKIDERGGCYDIPGGPDDLVLVQNSAGEIQHAVPRVDNARSRCFAAVYLGVKYPPPPFSPFFHFMQMQPKQPPAD